MKTRTLLLLAVGTALAILLAGGVLLLQLANSASPTRPTAFGQRVDIADVNVIVRSADVSEALVNVEVEIGGVDDDDWHDNFRLVTGDRQLGPLDDPESCPAITVAPQTCVLQFDVSGAESSSRVLVMRRGDDQATWRLDGATVQPDE